MFHGIRLYNAAWQAITGIRVRNTGNTKRDITDQIGTNIVQDSTKTSEYNWLAYIM